MNTQADEIRELIREGYGAIAASGGSCCSSKPACCGSSPAAADELVKQIGYSAAELNSLPEGSNMGLSCGNPNALAALQPGEVVLDLGAGGGFDVFIASGYVGAAGHAIGVDMTPEMLAKARGNLGEMTGFEDPLYQKVVAQLPAGTKPSDYIASLEVQARKPRNKTNQLS